MHYSLKHTAAAAKILPLMCICLMLAAACTAGRAAVIKISSSEYETENSAAYAETAEFSGMKNRDFQKELNENIKKDINGALISFDTMVSQSSDNIRMGNRCILEIRQLEKSNMNDFISIIEEHYVYTGGAHGSTVWYPRNIDAAAGRIIQLGDLFNTEDFAAELNHRIDEMLEADKEKYKDLWAHPKIASMSNFYIADGKLVIFFAPYELSYYARGFVEFPIKLSDIDGMLKEEYKRLI